MTVTFVFSVVVALVALYLFITRNSKHWQKRGIPCAKGAFPIVGHFWEVFTLANPISECCRKIYNDNRDRSMVGFYNFTMPTLMVREPELVKTVLQTSFANFHDNSLFNIDPEADRLLANNLFWVTGEKWVIARKRLTYAFSGMRLKTLLESVKQVCTTFEAYLDKKIGKTGKVEMNLKDLFARFTAQVVTGAGFGLDGLCFDEDKDKESFCAMGKYFLESDVWNNIMFIVVAFMPFLTKIFKIRFIPKKIDNIIRTMVAEVMEQRRKETTPRNDFLQLMVELERMEGDKFDIDVLASYAASFFLDGYESSSIVLSFVGFHLAAHPEVQKKLREEVVSVLKKYDGVITYEALKDMTYMDQVFSESQRVIPTLGYMFKDCTEATELKGSDGLVCLVERGTKIMIPISGLHKDPLYWENPEVFDPDRFSPERNHSIERFTFLPFGEGPRICVGMRMAQLQMKACMAAFLRKYSLELSPKQRLPIKMTPNFMATAEGGLWGIIRPL